MAANPPPPVAGTKRWWRSCTYRARLLGAASVGALVATGTGLASRQWGYAPVLGWAATAAVFVAWVWLVVAPLDPVETARHATREDPTRAVSDVLVLMAAVASLVAVGYVLVQASAADGTAKALLAGLGVATVALSWLVVHSLFMLRYALLYYGEPEGGIDFNQDARPRYLDFAYVSFTIGMTFQVSDTDLTSPEVRATALRHGLLSFVFGSLVVATTVNLVASAL